MLLNLHVDNGNAINATYLKSRLAELTSLGSFTISRVSKDSHIDNRCSGRRKTCMITPAAHSPPERIFTNAWPRSSAGTTIGIATAGSYSWGLSNVTANSQWRRFGNMLSCTNKRSKSIPGDGDDQSDVDFNKKWRGSAHPFVKCNPHQLSFEWSLKQSHGIDSPKNHRN